MCRPSLPETAEQCTADSSPAALERTGSPGHSPLLQLDYIFVDHQVPAQQRVDQLAEVRQGPFQAEIELLTLRPGDLVPVQQSAKFIHGRPPQNQHTAWHGQGPVGTFQLTGLIAPLFQCIGLPILGLTTPARTEIGQCHPGQKRCTCDGGDRGVQRGQVQPPSPNIPHDFLMEGTLLLQNFWALSCLFDTFVRKAGSIRGL